MVTLLLACLLGYDTSKPPSLGPSLNAPNVKLTASDRTRITQVKRYGAYETKVPVKQQTPALQFQLIRTPYYYHDGRGNRIYCSPGGT